MKRMMKRIISVFSFCLLLTLVLLPAEVAAKEYTVKEIPQVHLQDRTRYVSNPDAILSAASVATMDSLLCALEQQTGIQTLVAVVTGIEGGDCFDFTHRLAQETGVGQKSRNNGLVILLSTDERCIQFATGYGLEGVLPDAICKRIQERYMLDAFRQGDWDTGMVEGIRATCSILDGSMENIPDEEVDDELIVVMICFAIVFFLLAVLVIVYIARQSRCPQCKKWKLQRVDSHVVSRVNGVKTEEVTYICRNCGHTVVRREQSQDENYRGTGMGGGIFVGGGGRGFSGGGGFSGGSFGGGSFGGGGAGSRF
jgi:uncharacterized protein